MFPFGISVTDTTSEKKIEKEKILAEATSFGPLIIYCFEEVFNFFFSWTIWKTHTAPQPQLTQEPSTSIPNIDIYMENFSMELNFDGKILTNIYFKKSSQ